VQDLFEEIFPIIKEKLNFKYDPVPNYFGEDEAIEVFFRFSF